MLHCTAEETEDQVPTIKSRSRYSSKQAPNQPEDLPFLTTALREVV